LNQAATGSDNQGLPGRMSMPGSTRPSLKIDNATTIAA
jgi:hypothetical protein